LAPREVPVAREESERREGRERGGFSFRLRFFVIIGLTGLIVLSAVAALVQLARERDTASEQTASAHGDALVLALVRNLRGSSARRDALAMKGALDDLLSETPGASAGLCTRDGGIEVVRTPHPVRHAWSDDGRGPRPPGSPGVRAPPIGSPPEARPRFPSAAPSEPWPLAPDRAASGADELLLADRQLVEDTCRRAPRLGEPIAHRRRAMPGDILLLSATAFDDAAVAFVLMRAPPLPADGHRGTIDFKLALMGAASLLLVLVTVDSLLTLRRGARDLESALLLLQDDLRAPVPRPRARELARIGDGLGRMAAHLATARENEASLTRRLEHEERLAALGRLVAGVAHEVRNPLTGIKLKLDGLARRPADGATHADIETCLAEVGRLDRLVSSLLSVARTAPEERRTLDLAATCDERAGQLAALASERRVTLQRQGSAAIDGSREVVVRVLDNVLRNAIEASPEDGRVAVVVGADPERPEVVVLDEGGGVPEARLGELFEPFFTQKPDGVGLGLFASRALMRAQGWDLLYERRGASTAFVLRFYATSPDA
jgi:signal transduction histidine kinase